MSLMSRSWSYPEGPTSTENWHVPLLNTTPPTPYAHAPVKLNKFEGEENSDRRQCVLWLNRYDPWTRSEFNRIWNIAECKSKVEKQSGATKFTIEPLGTYILFEEQYY